MSKLQKKAFHDVFIYVMKRFFLQKYKEQSVTKRFILQFRQSPLPAPVQRQPPLPLHLLRLS